MVITVGLGYGEHAGVVDDLLYASFWLAKMHLRNTNIKAARLQDLDPTIAAIRDTYARENVTRLYVAYLYAVDPEDVATFTRNIKGYEENYPEQFKQATVFAEAEIRKAQINADHPNGRTLNG